MDAYSAFNFDPSEMEAPKTKHEWKIRNMGLRDGFLLGCKSERKKVQEELITFLGLDCFERRKESE